MAKKVQLEVDIKGGDSVGKAAEKTKTLKQELRELKNELASGNLTGKAFDEATQRAAKLSDTIIDVNNRVKALATDGADVVLKGFGDMATGIVGGFTAAQGAMALFGSENEDLQKTLVKLQGATALLNGLQQVNATLQGDSAAMVALNTAKTKILTAVQAHYTAVVGTTTGAMKLLRIAGASLGIGLIVTAIGLLISNFDKIKKAVLNFIPALGNLGKLFTNVKNAVMDFLGISSELERQEETASKQREVRSRKMQREIELMEASGASARDLYLAKRNLMMNDLESLKVAAMKKDATQEEIKAYNDLANAIKVLDAQEQKRIKDEGAKARDEQSKKNEESNKKAAEKDLKDKEDALKRAEDYNKKVLEKFEKQLEDEKKHKQELADIEEQYQEDLLNKEIAARQKLNEEKEKLEEDHLAKVEQYKAMEAQTEIDLQDAKIQAVQAGAQILGQLAGQNKALALSALAIEKGAAIAGVIINASRELSANAVIAAANPLNVATGGAAGAAQLAKSNALTKIRAGINIASISAAGISGARNISSSGGSGSGGGAVQPPNIRGSQTTNEQPTPQPTKVFVTEVDIRSSLRKVDGIYTQATIQ